MVGKMLRCKRAFAAGLCAAFLLSISGCQENPEGSIVVHKDMDNLISKAQNSDPEKTDAAQLAEEVREQFETYQTHLKDEDLRVTVNVDAKVDVPEVDKLSVYRVKQKKFDQEFVDKVRKALMGDKEVYYADYLFQQTRADIEESIKTYRDLMRQTEEDLEAGTPDPLSPLTEEELAASRQDLIESIQFHLDMLQERYETAPAELNLTDHPSDGKLHTTPELNEILTGLPPDPRESEVNIESLYLAADTSDGNYQVLKVLNSETLGNTLYYLSGPEYYLDPSVTAFQPLDPAAYGEVAPGNGSVPKDFLGGGFAFPEDVVFAPFENDATTISQAEAIDRAEAFLSEIGLSDFTFDEGGLFNEYAPPIVSWKQHENHAYRPYHILRFRRQIDGVLLSQSSGVKFAEGGDGESYRAQYWPGEQIVLRINDAGIAGFAYMAPIEVTETVVENAGLKAFSDVKGTFEKMICITNAPEDSNLTLSADVDRVRLSYSRISEKDNFDSGLIVPVWSFEGKRHYYFNDEIIDEYYTSMLAINAIDGSIIDGKLGY